MHNDLAPTARVTERLVWSTTRKPQVTTLEVAWPRPHPAMARELQSGAALNNNEGSVRELWLPLTYLQAYLTPLTHIYPQVQRITRI